MPKDKVSGKKTSLAEQGALPGTQEKRGEFKPFERRGKQLGWTTNMLGNNTGRKLEGIKPN